MPCLSRLCLKLAAEQRPPSSNLDLGFCAGFGPHGLNLGLEAGIWASKLGEGVDGRTEKEEEEEEKNPHMCESIGAAALLLLQLQAQPT